MSDEHVFGRAARHPEPDPVDLTPPPPEAGDEGSPGFSRRRLIVLGAVLTVGLAGAAAVGLVSWRIVQQKDAALDPPTQVAGLNRDDSDGARETADYLQTALAAELDLDKSVGVVYTDPADAARSVLLFGGTTLLWSPEKNLDALFSLVADDAGAVDSLHEVPAGDLGGVMKCGSTSSPEGGDIAVCGWADHGSIAVGMFPGRGVDESAGLLRDMRGEVQKRE